MHFLCNLFFFLRIFQTFLSVSQFTFLIISCLFTIFSELSSTLRSLEQEGNVIGGQQCSIASQLVQQHPDQVPHPHQQQVQVVQTSAPSAQPSAKTAPQMPSSPLTPSPSSTSSQDYDLNNLDDNQYKFPGGIQNSILKRSANDSVQVCILYLSFLNESIWRERTIAVFWSKVQSKYLWQYYSGLEWFRCRSFPKKTKKGSVSTRSPLFYCHLRMSKYFKCQLHKKYQLSAYTNIR